MRQSAFGAAESQPLHSTALLKSQSTLADTASFQVFALILIAFGCFLSYLEKAACFLEFALHFCHPSFLIVSLSHSVLNVFHDISLVQVRGSVIGALSVLSIISASLFCSFREKATYSPCSFATVPELAPVF